MTQPGVQSRTARTLKARHTPRMHIERLTTALLVFWLLALALAGTLGSFGIPGWALVTMLGVFSLIMVRQIGRGPAPTLSERINGARR